MTDENGESEVDSPEDAPVDWRARYKATYHVRKSDKKDSLVVFLDCSQFSGSGVLEPTVSGEVYLTTKHRIAWSR